MFKAIILAVLAKKIFDKSVENAIDKKIHVSEEEVEEGKVKKTVTIEF